MKNAQSWKQIYKTYGLSEAHIIVGQLESEGIPAKVHPLEAGSRLGITVGKLGEVAVMVPESYADDAEKLIFEPLPDNWEDEIVEDPELL